MDEVVVSVIIPTYNSAELLPEAVDSALGQTLRGVEVIVVDDASTDDTPEVMKRYGGSVRYIRLPENKGPGTARNTGLKHSKGRYVALLDSDDIFMPERLEKLVRFLDEHPEYGFATSDAYYMIGDEPSQRTYFDVPGLHFHETDQDIHILRSNFVGNKLVFRRELFERHGLYDESLWFEDWAHNVDFIMGGERCGLLAEPLAYHRVRPGSLTARAATVLEDRQTVLLHWMKAGLNARQMSAARTALAEVRWALIWTPEYFSDPKRAKNVLGTMIRDRGPFRYRMRAVLARLLPFSLFARLRRARADRIHAGGGHWALHEAVAKFGQGSEAVRPHLVAAALYRYPLKVRVLSLAWVLFPPLRGTLSRALASIPLGSVLDPDA